MSATLVTMSDDKLLDAVRAYHRAQAALDRKREELAVAIADAVHAGRKQADVARVTGYTREHIRRIVKDETHRRIGVEAAPF
jgi:DNA-binding phage protein